MRAVQDHLVAGVGVDGGHDTALDGRIIVQRFRHGRQAVGGAGSRRDDNIIFVQRFLVHAVHDGFQIAAGRSGDNHFFRARIDVSHALLFGAVEAGALQNDVNADLAPRQFGSVRFFIDGQGFAVHRDGVGFVVRGHGVQILTDLTAVTALSGVVFQQIRQHRGFGQIVDRNDIITLRAEHLTESQTADAAKTIDCNFNSHDKFLR